MPTLLELSEINLGDLLFWKSFAKILFDDSFSFEDEYTFSETGGLQGPYPSPMEPNVFCIKNKQFKLIYFKTPNEWKLFDIKNDPKELEDLTGKSFEIEILLKKKLLEWINR